jgi:hypothetical protein
MPRHLQSRSFNKKKCAQKWLGIVGSIGISMCLLYLVFSFFHARSFSITEVQIFGADADISDDIHSVVLGELQGNYLGVFPRAHAFLYPTQDIIYQIKHSFPRIQDVTIKRDDMTHLRVTVDEKPPRAIVCVMLPNFVDDHLITDTADTCYLADDTGLLFKKTSVISPHVYPLYFAPDIATLSSTTDFVGSYATSTTEFDLLQSFHEHVAQTNTIVDGILFKEAGEYELYSSSTVIYFNDSSSLPEQAIHLSAFLSHTQADDRAHKKQTIFDYIDLRYGSNVFYKLVQ